MSCVNLSKITIPRRVTSIGPSAFAGCAGLTEMTILNPIPPTFYNNTYEITNVYTGFNCLYVPNESVDQYRNAEHWKNFPCIQPLAPTPIRPVAQNKTTAAPPAIASLKNNRVHLNLPVGAYTAALINIKGRVVSRAKITATEGLSTFDLRANHLAKGAYLLEVRRMDGAQVVRERIVLR